MTLESEGSGSRPWPPSGELALLVHDMVNDRVMPGGKHPDAGRPEMAELISNHVQLLGAARQARLPVFYSGHALREDYKDAAFGAKSPERGAVQAGSWGAQVIDELAPAADDWILRKGGGYSAFTGTPFEKWLRRLNVTTVIVAGAGTPSGIESTVRDARERDIATIVVADACTGQAGYHEASLRSMARLTGTLVVSTAEVLASLAGPSEAKHRT